MFLTYINKCLNKTKPNANKYLSKIAYNNILLKNISYYNK